MLRKQIWQILMRHQMSREREGSGMAGLGTLGRWCCHSGADLDISWWIPFCMCWVWDCYVSFKWRCLAVIRDWAGEFIDLLNVYHVPVAFPTNAAVKNRHSSCPTWDFLRRGQRYLVTEAIVIMTRTIKHVSQRPNCMCIHGFRGWSWLLKASLKKWPGNSENWKMNRCWPNIRGGIG